MSTSGCAHFLSFLVALFIVLQYVAAVLGELRTIDDTFGDSVTGATPTYFDADCWNKGPGCSICVSQPDPSQAHNGTWHDTQSNVCNNALSNSSSHTVAFAFTGTSLSVYCIFVSQGPDIKVTNLTFNLDGASSASQFTPSINATTYGYQYNVPVYSRTSLNNTLHVFGMSAVQGTSPSLLLFDYATYDYEDDGSDASSSSSQSASSQASTASNVASHHGTPVSAIAGGVAGSITFVVICVCLAIYRRRRRRTRRVTEEMTHIPDPFIYSTISSDSGTAPVPRVTRRASQLPVPVSLPHDTARETGSGDLDSAKGPPPAYCV